MTEYIMTKKKRFHLAIFVWLRLLGLVSWWAVIGF